MLILDEPTDGLDPNQKHEVRSLIKSMAKEKVIVLSTHILEEVHAVCSRAIIIANGQLVADGTPAELESQSDSYNAVTLSVQAPLAMADKTREKLLTINGVDQLRTLHEKQNDLCYQLVPVNKQSIVMDVNQFARDQQWKVTELHVDTGQLDDVFRKITTKQGVSA